MPDTSAEQRFFRQLGGTAEPQLSDSALQELAEAEAENDDVQPVVESRVDPEPKPDSAPEDTTPFVPQRMLSSHDTHPLVLDALLLRVFGPDWLGWEPEALAQELRRVTRQELSGINWQQIQAVKTCHLVDSPWRTWEVFAVVCQALNNCIPNFRTLQVPTVAQVLCALDIMGRIDNHLLSDEVEQFIAATFVEEGVHYLPPPADVAQEWLSRPVYRCTVCGRVDRDDSNDMCDSCGAPQDKLQRELTRDPEPIRIRYEECLQDRAGHSELQETPVDIQAARLLVAHDYVVFRRAQLQQQVKELNRVQLFD